jgi:hypothetical protein
MHLPKKLHIQQHQEGCFTKLISPSAMKPNQHRTQKKNTKKEDTSRPYAITSVNLGNFNELHHGLMELI